MKNSIKTTLLVISVILLLNMSLLMGQENVGFATKGTKELGGSITYQSITPVSNGVTGTSISIFSVQPYIGTFFTDGFEVGISPGLMLESSSGFKVTEWMILLSPSYNFKTDSKVYPFLEASIGYTNTSISGSTSSSSMMMLGGRGGIKIAITNQGLLNIGLQYIQQSLVGAGSTDQRNGTNQLSLSAGFTVWF